MDKKEYLTETIGFRVTSNMKKKLEKAMSILGINSMSALINFLLNKALKNLK